MARLASISTGFAALLIVVLAASGQVPASDSLLDRPIGSIKVQGLDRVPEQLVLNNIRSEVGGPFDPETTNEDLKRLNRLGEFADIDILTSQSTDGTVKLIYLFRENRLLAAVSVVGNRVLPDSALLGPTGLRRGSPRDDFLILRGEREMEELYESKGYYMVEVSIDRSELEDNDILIYKITEGPRGRVRAIEFVGADKSTLHGNDKEMVFSDKELAAEIKTQIWFPFFRVGAMVRDQLDADAAALQRFYYDRGWIDADVDWDYETSVSQREIKVYFEIDEGKQYTVARLYAEGSFKEPLNVLSTEQIAAIMNIKVGDVFRQDLVKQSRKSLRDAYGVMGYLDTAVQITEERRGESTGLTLKVEIKEGTVADVGLVSITGNSLTKDKVIREQVGFRPGRRFDAREIEDTKDRILSTGLFGDALVSVQEPDPSTPTTRDVVVEIKEKNTGSINFGVGFGSDSGVIGNISLIQNNFDLFDVPETFGEFMRGRSFRGAGQRFAINFNPGTEVFNYDITLTEPRIFGSPYALGGMAGYFRRDYDGYTEERSSAGTTLSRRLGDVWYGSLRLDVSSVELTGLSAVEPVEVQNDAGPETLISTGLILTRTTIDRMSRPTRGSRTQWNIANWGLLGGDRNFNRVGADYTTYLALDRDFLGRVTTLRLDGQVGQIFGGEAPTYDQFYLGGRSLRGFQFRTVSPRGTDASGDIVPGVPVGGRFMVFLGAQYQRPLIGELLDGVVFVDSGTVNDDLGFDQYRLSVGFGIRVYIPQLGPTPLAFDFAFPIMKQEYDETQLFSFSADLPF